MRGVWKYRAQVGLRPTVPAANGPVVHVGRDMGGEVCVWIDGDLEDTSMRAFRVFGTGQEIPADAVHVGSWIELPFVWHVYEVSA